MQVLRDTRAHPLCLAREEPHIEIQKRGIPGMLVRYFYYGPILLRKDIYFCSLHVTGLALLTEPVDWTGGLTFFHFYALKTDSLA